jgi:hypothetical protein
MPEGSVLRVGTALLEDARISEETPLSGAAPTAETSFIESTGFSEKSSSCDSTTPSRMLPVTAPESVTGRTQHRPQTTSAQRTQKMNVRTLHCEYCTEVPNRVKQTPQTLPHPHLPTLREDCCARISQRGPLAWASGGGGGVERHLSEASRRAHATDAAEQNGQKRGNQQPRAATPTGSHGTRATSVKPSRSGPSSNSTPSASTPSTCAAHTSTADASLRSSTKRPGPREQFDHPPALRLITCRCSNAYDV